ncbi:hypothetical protein [Amycolatopsis sp. NPDC058986]|uniref:hypothetical protein n=1 Tax=unclassified Amycolatopsis TaxID=2618356 RepID=UPI0036733F68
MLPDPHAHGAWVDQWNGRFCGGNPQFPHLAAQQPPPPGGGSKKPWIIGGSILGVVLVIGLVVVLVVTLTGKSGDTAAPASQTPPPSAPASSSAPPTDPNAPVPCDPESRVSRSCFPPKVTGQAFLDRIAQKQKWPCFKKGEKDGAGDTVRDLGVCKAANDVEQPYLMSASIGYDTHTHELQGTMNEVLLVASTTARPWKNEKTDVGKTKDVAINVMGIAVANLWPDDKALQDETKQAFAKIEEQCAGGGRTSVDGPKATLHNGFEVSCSSIDTIGVNDPRGATSTIVQTMRIEAPLRAPQPSR